MSDVQKVYRYFSPSPGNAVARWGTTQTIGATRGPKGFIINPEAVVRIPEEEIARHRREYIKAVERKELVERTEADFNAWKAKRDELRRKVTETGSIPAVTDEDIAAAQAAKESQKNTAG